MHSRHGLTKHPIYTTWRAMKQRCMNPKNDWWHNYGGRGIQLDPTWEEFTVFHAWALSSGWSEGLTIERENVDGDYCPSNCTWVTRLEQAKNKSNLKGVTVGKKTLNILQWSKLTGIPQATLYKRFHAGIRGAKFIAAPVNPATPKGIPVRVV